LAKVNSFPPVYTHPTDRATENLRRALPFINQHRTPVNPVNYAVWYEYVSGENEALSRAINQRLNNGEKITDELNQKYFEKYVLMGMPDRLSKANTGMQIVVNNTLKNIDKAESTADQCANGLSNTQNHLESCQDVNEMKNLVKDIISHSQTLAETSLGLKQELHQSSQDIQKLKAELDEVKKAARTDGLTGLLNRGALNQELTKVCEPPHNRTAFVLFDIDHFKQLNDNYGHLVGDKVLQYFSGILKKHTNDSIEAARYGGEEFALILMGYDQSEAQAIADKIREELANSKLKKRGSDESIGKITVSAGVTGLMPEDSPASLIERADQALYMSKASGRNQVNIS
jgi:diguanylate cyclase